MKTTCALSCIPILMICGLGCAQKPVRPATTVSQEMAQYREPAADSAAGGATEAFLKSFDPAILADYLKVNHQGKTLRYEVRSRLWTNMGKNYLTQKGKKALQEALEKSLVASDQGQGGFSAQLKINLVKEVIDEFIKTPTFFKLIDGVVQWDLYFIPLADSPNDYSPELASNHLISVSDRGKLSDKLARHESWNLTDHIRSFWKERKSSPAVMGDESGYSYAGGVITFYFKTLDMHWNPLRKLIPSPTKNAVKGFVRYRRYFLGPQSSGQTLGASGANCGTLQWEKPDGTRVQNGRQFYTVDVYKNFNLAGFIPQPETVEIFPGRLIPPNKGPNWGQRDLLPKGFFKTEGDTGKTIHTGALTLLSQEKPDDTPVKVKQELVSLVYSVDKKEWAWGDSVVRAQGEMLRYPWDEDFKKGDKGAEEAKRRLFEGCQKDLIEQFRMSRFSKVFATGGAQ